MPKRGNGEGTIRERADGRWEARVTYRIDGEARLRRKSVYRTTRKGAHEEMVAMLSDLRVGTAPRNDRVTVNAFLEDWLADRRGQVRPATWRRYAQIVRCHLAPALGGVRLTKLSPAQVQDMLGRVQANGLSARSTSHVRAVLRAALARAGRWGLVSRNVAALTDAPKVVSARRSSLTVEELRQVFRAAARTDLEAIVMVAGMTGLRQSEILGLQWACIDFEGMSIRIDSQLQRVAGAWCLADVKTVQSRRVVPMTATLADALRRERARQTERRVLAAAEWHEPIDGLVFTTGRGRPLHGTSVTHAFQRLLAAAGMVRRPFHNLRATTVTLMASEGVEIATVKDLMGHADIRTTMNVYASALPSRKLEAASRMEALLGTRIEATPAGLGSTVGVTPQVG